MFDATKAKYRDVDFQRYNVDEEQAKTLSNQYNVKTIPHVVMLDASGKVLYNGGSWNQPEDFGQLSQR